MTTDSQLGMASGSKTFTALVVLRLVEEGLLGLSTTARQVLGLICRSSRTTSRSSICSLTGPASATTSTRTSSTARTTCCCLGNGGFVVLALIAQRVSGRSYHDLVRDLVCSPAGMADTEFLRSDALPGRAARGYVEVEGQWRSNVFHLPVIATGDGGTYTTTADMARFWTALTSGRIVRVETLADMGRARGEPDPGESSRYGLGLWLEADSPRVTMSGADAGVSFWSSHHPERGTTATVISATIGGAWPLVEIVEPHV